MRDLFNFDNLNLDLELPDFEGLFSKGFLNWDEEDETK